MSCFQRRAAPDSCWSWLVCLSANISVSTVLGLIMSFGVFQPYLMEYFGENKEKTSWVGSIAMGVVLFSGTFAVFLTDRFGYRTVNMACGFICSASALASSFVNQLTVLYFSFSVLYGLCGGIILNMALSELRIHFKKYFALTSGIVISGATSGMLILTQVNEVLLEKLGWRYSFRIMSGLICAATFTSITYDSRIVSQREEVMTTDPKTVKLSLEDENNGKLLQENKMNVVVLGDVQKHQEENSVNTSEEENQVTSLLEKSTNLVATDSQLAEDVVFIEGRQETGTPKCDSPKTHNKMTLKDVLLLLKNVDFVFGVVSVTLVCLGVFTPQIHLMQFSLDLGMSYSKSAQLYIYYSIANIVSRLASPHIASKVKLSPLVSLQLAEFLCGISVILFSLAKTYGHLVVFTIAYGAANGAVLSINILFAMTVTEPARGGLAIGLDFMMCSITTISGPPFAGYIADVRGSYVMSFYVAGGIMMFGALLPCILHIKRLIRDRYTPVSMNVDTDSRKATS